MSTFTSTTLAKRTGATTTDFLPSGVASGYHYLRASGASVLTGPYLRCKQVITNDYRRADIRLVIPELDNGAIVRRPAVDLSLYVPAGSSSDNVNDMVGYIEALTSDSLTNFDSFLVAGVGMY
jgi:hypothetical protein